MTDITITKGPIGEELDVAHVEGQTGEGVEFIDAYSGGEFTVVDSGRIIIPAENVAVFIDAAVTSSLSVETTDNG